MNEEQAKQPAAGWTPLGYKEDSRPQRGWWAPGSYMNCCVECGEAFIGDKRAGSCADCAYREAADDSTKRETNTEGVCSSALVRGVSCVACKHCGPENGAQVRCRYPREREAHIVDMTTGSGWTWATAAASCKHYASNK